ncbi:YoaK family protein [Streptomyces sp. NPDC058739]|uniref:YoaK family protein n=1 Tax=Streptomyces sp. NPDC058739 TaxID=3346618 RepID=UPI0036D0C2F6
MRALLADAWRTLAPGPGEPQGPLPPLLLVLTAVSGLVDAVGYLALGQVFVANMTGNVVLLGFALAGDDRVSALGSAVALGTFLAGAVTGGRIATRFAAHRGRLFAVGTAAETALVAVALAVLVSSGARIGTGVRYTLIVCLGTAMGLQSAVARRLGVPDLTTTVLTQTLTGLAADPGEAGGGPPRPGRRLLAVLTMLLGALAGGLLVLHGHVGWALALCLALPALVSLTAVRLSRADAPWVRPRR